MYTLTPPSFPAGVVVLSPQTLLSTLLQPPLTFTGLADPEGAEGQRRQNEKGISDRKYERQRRNTWRSKVIPLGMTIIRGLW